ncbi:MAG TPA: hypothetical protein VNZ49_04930 [Bacteroidia bacterium]|jgi:hypothetical protein|nr:hypothetical protein [Bacteroidia bacterium]
MKKLLLQITLLSGLMLVLQGCPYNSEIAIDEPAVKTDAKLLGKWEPKNSGDYMYTVTKKSDYLYDFSKKSKNTPTDTSSYLGYVSLIDGVQFLNVYDKYSSSTKTYYLYKMEMTTSGAKITLSPVTENITEKFANSADLKAFIKKYMALSFFYSKDKEEYFRAD